MARITIARRMPQPVLDRLRAAGHELVEGETDAPLDQAGLIRAFQDSDGVLVSVGDRIDVETLDAGGSRRAGIVANFGVGVNHIDLEAAKARGVVVTNTPDVLTDATADLAMALILTATRRMSESEAALRRGDWRGFSPTGGLGVGLQGKTLGIIGMGRIGQATARRAVLGFGMKAIYFNRSPQGPFDFPAEARPSFEAVLEEADVVSLHMPGGDGNARALSAERIARMKPGAYLVNTARGDVVDEPALIAALAEGRLAGAGLDVFAEEPKVPQALIDMPHVTLLPHIGSATIETRTAMGLLAADNLVAWFAGEPLPSRVA